MKKSLYVIKDIEANSCGPVMDIKNDVVAKRYYRKVVEEQKIDSSIFRLFKIADYDDENGLVLGYSETVDITADLESVE
mgnify:CR=1 FL=1